VTTPSGKTDLPLAELIARLKHPEPTVRQHAAAALGQMGRKARRAVPCLAEALQDPDTRVRRLAALALGDIGPEAAAAVPALVGALNDGHAAVRRRAAVALGEIGAVAAVRALAEAGEDEDDGVRELATASLQRIERAVRARAA
jgi:HEAT repeat protein